MAERRAAAARRSGIASWAVVVSVSAAIAATIAVTLRMGASAPHDAHTTEAQPAPALALPPPDTATQPAAPPPSPPPPPPADDEHDPAAPPAAAPPGSSAQPVEPARVVVEPARVVTERPPPSLPIAATAPPPAPPPAAYPAAALSPDVAPPRAAPQAATGADFDQASARVALSMAAAQASSCKQPDDPGGAAKVHVTFAPSGHAVSAQVIGRPFQGTRTGACIARMFHRVTVPPFSGDPVAVTKTVTVR